MKRKFLTTALLVCCVAIVTAAAFLNIAGTWAGDLKMADGNVIALSYNFKQDGEKITGTVNSPQGELAIEGGKIAGDVVTFTVNVQGMDIPNSGKIYADSIGMDVTIGDDKLHTKLLKKAK